MRSEWVALSFLGLTSYSLVDNVRTFDSPIWIINRPLHWFLGFWACWSLRPDTSVHNLRLLKDSCPDVLLSEFRSRLHFEFGNCLTGAAEKQIIKQVGARGGDWRGNRKISYRKMEEKSKPSPVSRSPDVKQAKCQHLSLVLFGLYQICCDRSPRRKDAKDWTWFAYTAWLSPFTS